MERLKGKIAMVVGAGSIGPGWGNGKATAVTFARQGAQLFCVDRNGAAAEETVKKVQSHWAKSYEEKKAALNTTRENRLGYLETKLEQGRAAVAAMPSTG